MRCLRLLLLLSALCPLSFAGMVNTFASVQATAGGQTDSATGLPSSVTASWASADFGFVTTTSATVYAPASAGGILMDVILAVSFSDYAGTCPACGNGEDGSGSGTATAGFSGSIVLTGGTGTVNLNWQAGDFTNCGCGTSFNFNLPKQATYGVPFKVSATDTFFALWNFEYGGSGEDQILVGFPTDADNPAGGPIDFAFVPEPSGASLAACSMLGLAILPMIRRYTAAEIRRHCGFRDFGEPGR
jgi:hypothetical protein